MTRGQELSYKILKRSLVCKDGKSVLSTVQKGVGG